MLHDHEGYRPAGLGQGRDLLLNFYSLLIGSGKWAWWKVAMRLDQIYFVMEFDEFEMQ